jgi:hypothetical protein
MSLYSDKCQWLFACEGIELADLKDCDVEIIATILLYDISLIGLARVNLFVV